jgi:NDP-sugar pyrophosphorylase family protein
MTKTPVPVVLAAGLGTRLGRREPKSFVHVAGRPVLERTIKSLGILGMTDGVFVSGFEANSLSAFVGGFPEGRNARFVINPNYAETGTARSLALGLNAVDPTRSVVILEADVVFETALLAELLNVPARDAIAVEREQPVHSGSVVTLDAERSVESWYHENKRPHSLMRGQAWKTVNIHMFSPVTWRDFLLPNLAAVEALEGPEAPAESAYARLVRDVSVLGVDVGRWRWFEIDTPLDLVEAELRFQGIDA